MRTHNKHSPFPEEMNRLLTGRMADLHLLYGDGEEEFAGRGVAPFSIWVTGNTVIDALYQTVKPDYPFTGDLAELDFDRRFILVTTHRRENWGERMKEIYRALCDILDEFADVDIVFPVHKNPVVRKTVEEILGGHERVHLIEPLDYEPFAHLMNSSYLVMTDSGGLQEEAPSLGKPVLVLRIPPSARRRWRQVLCGWWEPIAVGHMRRHGGCCRMRGPTEMARAVNPYGDGQAASRIAKVVRDYMHARYSGNEG